MKRYFLFSLVVLFVLAFSACQDDGNGISVVLVDQRTFNLTPPVTGGTPANSITVVHGQFTAFGQGAVKWESQDGNNWIEHTGNFASSTFYRAIVTLTPATGRTFANFTPNPGFTINGDNTNLQVTHAAAGTEDVRIVTVVFPRTSSSPMEIIVTVEGGATAVAPGATLQFINTVKNTDSGETVTGTAANVTWSISSSGHHNSTAISNTGLLSVHNSENPATRPTLTIRATLASDSSVTGEITVAVGTPLEGTVSIEVNPDTGLLTASLDDSGTAPTGTTLRYAFHRGTTQLRGAQPTDTYNPFNAEGNLGQEITVTVTETGAGARAGYLTGTITVFRVQVVVDGGTGDTALPSLASPVYGEEEESVTITLEFGTTNKIATFSSTTGTVTITRINTVDEQSPYTRNYIINAENAAENGVIEITAKFTE